MDVRAAAPLCGEDPGPIAELVAIKVAGAERGEIQALPDVGAFDRLERALADAAATSPLPPHPPNRSCIEALLTHLRERSPPTGAVPWA